MTENVTNELLLEHLKKIQTKLVQHDERFDRIENELRALKAHVAALVTNDLTRDTDQAAILLRVERIERRLDLSD